jgi:hypothetical protein
MLALNWRKKRFYTAALCLQERFMFVAILLIGPVGIAALFAFAVFADRHFRDTAVFRQDRAPLCAEDQVGSGSANQPRGLEVS